MHVLVKMHYVRNKGPPQLQSQLHQSFWFNVLSLLKKRAEKVRNFNFLFIIKANLFSLNYIVRYNILIIPQMIHKTTFYIIVLLKEKKQQQNDGMVFLPVSSNKMTTLSAVQTASFKLFGDHESAVILAAPSWWGITSGVGSNKKFYHENDTYESRCQKKIISKGFWSTLTCVALD